MNHYFSQKTFHYNG